MRAARVVFAAWLLFGGAACAAEADPCRGAVPPALAEALRQRFPGFRVPARSDESRDIPPNVASSLRKAGANGCLSIASGDFDGDGLRDFAILLARETLSTDAKPVRLAVALRRGEGWSLDELPTWCSSIGWCHVAAVGPGTYKRTTSMDAPLEPAERKVVTLKHQGIASGAPEATEVLYGREQGSWVYLWLSQ
ncbi:MAG: hypothetical protein D3M94_22380 [Rhodocyclales bacterium GT-UBC]|nr:MAG: hypothetical protein D3M94_22380 [Rhodocyclales bacterium GT-UBC]